MNPLMSGLRGLNFVVVTGVVLGSLDLTSIDNPG